MYIKEFIPKFKLTDIQLCVIWFSRRNTRKMSKRTRFLKIEKWLQDIIRKRKEHFTEICNTSFNIK
jgi:hypothetical protein